MTNRLLSPLDFVNSDDDESSRKKLISFPILNEIEKMAPSGRTIETRINSFHESDRTDSGFAGDTGSTWRFSHSYQPTHDSQRAGKLKFSNDQNH